ncbi:MAG: hypothetical protein ACLQVY_16125 [Limisphaerales bacterium]
MHFRYIHWEIEVVFAACALLLLLASNVQTDAQVPAEFTNLYAELQSNITNFEATLDTNWNGLQTDCSMGAVLMPATSEGRGWGTSGDASRDTNFLNNIVVPYLNGLQAMGITSVKFAIQFPVLYQPYYDATNGANNPAGYTNTFNFYTNLCALLRQRGIKIIIPVGDLVSPDTTVANYEENLTFAQFLAGRSAINQTVAKYLKPDYLLLQSEPNTEADNLPPSLGNQFTNAAADMNMISNFLSDLQATGLRTTNMIVGAGCGTWQQDFTNFLSGFTNLAGLDLLSIHVYQITVHSNIGLNHLQRVLQMADAAHGANTLHPHGMRVGISECWLKKVSLAEEQMNAVTGNTINGRNVYSCFAPLDREFHLSMVKAGYYERMDFIEPYWTEYYFSYLDYNQMQPIVQSLVSSNWTADQIGLFLQNTNQSLVLPVLAMGQQTAAAQGYSEYLQPGPPTLWITNNVAGSVSLGWSPVALDFFLEHKSHLLSSSSNWTSIPILPRTVGNDFNASIITTNEREFYRLHLP